MNLIIYCVFYQNPSGVAAADVTGSGVIVIANSITNSFVLVARLMEGENQIAVVCGGLGAALPPLTPPFPLASSQSYYVQVQIVPFQGGSFNPNTIISGVNWSSDTTVSCPVVSATLLLAGGQVEISGTTLTATFSWTNDYPVSAYAAIFGNGPALSLTLQSCSKNSIGLSFAYNAACSTYEAILRPMIPLGTPATWPSSTLPTANPYSAGSGISYLLPTQSPSITSVTYDGTTVSATWTGPAPAAGADPVSYELLLTYLNSGISTTYAATATGGSASLPLPGSSDAYTVAARMNYGVIKGPLSTAVPVITGTVNNIVQNLDSANGTATLTWNDASGFNATGFAGYTETFNLTFSNGTPATATSGSTSYSLTGTLLANFVNTVAIAVSASAAGVTTTGPSSTPASFSFTPSLFFASVLTPGVPLLYPAPTLATIAQQQPAAITVYLPAGNYAANSKTISPPVQYPATSPVFSLAANSGSNSAQYPYTLTIASPPWNTHAIRSALQADYIGFLEAAETANVSPWGIAVIQEAIARNMPQTFAEMLYYNYGLNLAAGYADLRPGMVLRIMPSDYMVVPGYDRDQSTMSYLNGYTNSAPLDYDISGYIGATGWMAGFDAFISQLVAGGALAVSAPPTTQAPNVGSIAEAADLYFLQQPFYRLFFPATLLTPTGPGASTPSAQFNVAAASSYTNLQASTNGAASNTNTYFRGRAIVKLCIRVIINGNEAVVPIGTTVANMLERAGRMPPGSGVSLTGITLQRAMGRCGYQGNTSWQVGRSYDVRFDSGPLAAYGNGQSALDLPLLHGDILTF